MDEQCPRRSYAGSRREIPVFLLRPAGAVNMEWNQTQVRFKVGGVDGRPPRRRSAAERRSMGDAPSCVMAVEAREGSGDLVSSRCLNTTPCLPRPKCLTPAHHSLDRPRYPESTYPPEPHVGEHVALASFRRRCFPVHRNPDEARRRCTPGGDCGSEKGARRT